MIEIGVFHNGASDLPRIRTPSGVVVNDVARRGYASNYVVLAGVSEIDVGGNDD